MIYLVDFVNGTTAEDIVNYVIVNDCKLLRKFNSYAYLICVESSNTPPIRDGAFNVIPTNTNIGKVVLSKLLASS